MEDWRFVEEMRTAAVSARTAAGLADFPDDVPVSDRINGWLRLEAWDRLAAVPRLPETSSLTDRMTVGHARALAAIMSGRADDAEAELAELVALMAEARAPGAGGMTAAEVAAAAELVTEVQLHQLAARGETEAARGQFASLRHLPPGRLARLALRLDLPLEAIRNARMASQMRPNAQPEKRLLLAVTTATEQRLPPEDEVAAMDWPPVPAPAAPPPAADSGQMPSWSVLDAAGTPRTLEEIQDGRPAVILFFLGHECRHCMDQLRTFEPMAARFEQAGARLIAISADGPDGVNQTWASLETDPVRRRFSFPVFAGAGLEAFRQWGVMDAFYGQAIHGVFVLDAGRRLRWRHLGVEPFTDVSDVLAAVYGLAAGQ
jgi:peroxiredoxin